MPEDKRRNISAEEFDQIVRLFESGIITRSEARARFNLSKNAKEE